jgi:SAM-dependent methyltransferase
LIPTSRLLPFTFLWRISRTLPDMGLILDAGCGTGQVASQLKRSGHRFIGLEIDDSKLAAARGKRTHFAMVLASVEQLPFRSGSFDCVLSTEVIEHLKFDGSERALTEFQRVAGGTVIVTTPNGEGEEPKEAESNLHQAHECAWTASDLIERGFIVRGLGLKWAWGPGGHARRGPTVRRITAAALSFALGPLTSRRPDMAAGLLATSNPRARPKDPRLAGVVDWRH